MNNKPSVFPSTTPKVDTPKTTQEYEDNKAAEVSSLFDNYLQSGGDDAYVASIQQMKEKNELQLKQRTEVASTEMQYETMTPPQVKVETPQPTFTQKPIADANNEERFLSELSTPHYDAPFDILPLPSEGKLYKHKKGSIKVAFMTTTDESILTSPNLLKSGRFLDVLMNRKIIEQNIRYQDLHIGDRDAIMIWLRATSYGHQYPVICNDENGNPFNTVVDLSELKTKKLGAEPDENGLFDYTFKLSGANIKFKLLTVKDVDEISVLSDVDSVQDFFINKYNNYTLQKQIVSIDGNTDKYFIETFVNNLRIGDATGFREYSTQIESGIDLRIEVKTPGGGLIKTFLPLNTSFFWPNLGI